MGYPEGGAMSFEYTAKAWDVHIPKVDGAARGYVKLVYMALVDYASAKNDFKAWPSLETLATKCCIPRSSVQSAIDALITLGLITKEQRNRPRHNQKRNGKTGALMKQSNMYSLNVKILERQETDDSPIPADGKRIPADGNTMYREPVSNLLKNQLENQSDINNFSDEKSLRLNKSPGGNLPSYPNIGNSFGEVFSGLDSEAKELVINCYRGFHQAAEELKYIDHTWNPEHGLELLAINYEKLWLLEGDERLFYEFVHNRYKARRIEQNKKKVNLAWLIWSNDEDSTGYEQTETILTEGDNFNYEGIADE
tara:strand:- start:389 stop:1318 length:930 start_codon:yes stop_codon:yes gene_type:complete